MAIFRCPHRHWIQIILFRILGDTESWLSLDILGDTGLHICCGTWVTDITTFLLALAAGSVSRARHGFSSVSFWAWQCLLWIATSADAIPHQVLAALCAWCAFCSLVLMHGLSWQHMLSPNDSCNVSLQFLCCKHNTWYDPCPITPC